MKLTIDEMDYLGLDEEHRYIRDDGADAELIRQRRAARCQPACEGNRAAFSLEPHCGPVNGLPAHLRAMRLAWANDSDIEDTRTEER